MNILFTMMLLLCPITAYANVDNTFEKFLYNDLKVIYHLPKIKKPNINQHMEWAEYIPTVMQIYMNSFTLQQYRDSNFTLVVEKLNWKEIKIGVRYYF